MSSAWKNAIDDHLDFLRDLDGDHDETGNAVRISDSATFTFLRTGEQEHDAEIDEGGTYKLAGEKVRGYVQPDDITLAVADLVTFEARRWRVFSAVKERLVGSEVVVQAVVLTALEG